MVEYGRKICSATLNLPRMPLPFEAVFHYRKSINLPKTELANEKLKLI